MGITDGFQIDEGSSSGLTNLEWAVVDGRWVCRMIRYYFDDYRDTNDYLEIVDSQDALVRVWRERFENRLDDALTYCEHEGIPVATVDLDTPEARIPDNCWFDAEVGEGLHVTDAVEDPRPTCRVIGDWRELFMHLVSDLGANHDHIGVFRKVRQEFEGLGIAFVEGESNW